MRLAEFKQARARTGEIEMSVTGRTSDREIAIPVWLVEEGAKDLPSLTHGGSWREEDERSDRQIWSSTVQRRSHEHC